MQKDPYLWKAFPERGSARFGDCLKELDRFPSANNPRNRLQIVRDPDVFPPTQQIADTVDNGAADFNHHPPAGAKRPVRPRDKTRDNFRSHRTTEYSGARLVFSDFELHLIFFRLADVGRIGNDYIEGRSQSCEQVRLMKLDSIFKLMSRRIGLRNFESSSRNVRRVNFGIGQLFR